MAAFKIIQTDARQYKNQIVEFWDQYLPGTPRERFEWMSNNPAGPAIWFLAFDDGGNNLAGSLSIMPKKMILNRHVVRCGIMGDFMVDTKYRVFGPALDLQKIAVQKKKELEFEFIYTIPNQASIKLTQRVGFKKVIDLHYLIKPIDVSYYLSKYVHRSLSRLIAPFAKQLLNIFSKETFIVANGYFEEVPDVNREFDELWERIKNNRFELIGDHSSEYLRWRYIKNPLLKFRLLTHKKDSGGTLLGYIIFTVNDRKMEIFDIIALQESYAYKLLKKLINVAGKENCIAIYFRTPESNSFYSCLRPLRFHDTNGDACILCVGSDNSFYDGWEFFEGDRNI